MNLSRVFQKKNWLFIAFSCYALIRIFSYLFPPETLANTLLSLFIAIIVGILLFKRNNFGWIIVLAELVLGGGGGFLAIDFLSLRTALLVISIPLFAIRNFPALQILWKTERTTFFVLAIFIANAGRAAWLGFYNHHPLQLVIADAIPYAFAMYYFPARTLLSDEEFVTASRRLLPVGIWGKCIFTLGTFIAFSFGMEVLQGHYYHWFRDMAGGKITDLGFHFFRIVLNEHLLTVPVLLLTLGKKITSPFSLPITGKNSRVPYIESVVLLIILAVNLTRIYYIAFAVGILILFSIRTARRWLIYSALSIAILCLSFVSIHTIASRGQSLGLELFGLRLQSIVSPAIENSSLSRLVLLPNILNNIKKHPLLGAGLGDQVTVFSPVVHLMITTPQFDWGYLEIVDEFGFIGLIGWIIWGGFIGYELWMIRRTPFFHPIAASLGALAIINLTSPALFHVLGIFWFTISLCEIQLIKKRSVVRPVSTSDAKGISA